MDGVQQKRDVFFLGCPMKHAPLEACAHFWRSYQQEGWQEADQVNKGGLGQQTGSWGAEAGQESSAVALF